MKFTLFIVVFLFSFSVFGQENKLNGEWIMTKVVLEEEPYKQPENRVIRSFTSIKQPLEHFLLNQCITKLDWTDQEQFVELENTQIQNFKLKEENGFLIIDEETGSRLIYHYYFENSMELLLTTPDIFFSNTGTSMKANLKIRMKKNEVAIP